MKLNKKQNEIYNFILKHKGYLKKSAFQLLNLNSNWTNIKDCELALKEARINNPGYSGEKMKAYKVNGTFVKNQVVKPLLKTGVLYKDSMMNNIRSTPGIYYITGCAHAPWHNKKMYDSVFKFLSKEIELEGIILAGDIADMNSLSSHDRGKIPINGVTLDWEYKEVNKFLDEFDKLKYKSINSTKDFIYGNHEDRYNRIKKDSDIAKYGDSLISPIVGLNLLSRGYRVYDNWKSDGIILGNHLEVNHGEFLNVHSAKKTIDTYRKSVLYFHTHRFQIFVEGMVGGWNMGAGADFNAPVFNYATRAMKTSWINSSCLVTIDEEGYYHIQPLMWINNQLIINGKKY